MLFKPKRKIIDVVQEWLASGHKTNKLYIVNQASQGIIDMNQKITLRELSSPELELLLKEPKFNRLRPVSCSECGNQTNFSRRVFEVKGKKLATDEDVKNLACYHVQTAHHCDSVFLKTRGKQYYIDTARCPNCNSTKIVYDIELNDEFLEEAAKFLNIPSSSIKRELESFLKSSKRNLN